MSFCGQDIRDLPLIGAFRTVFSRDYKAFRDDIRAMRGEIEARFGEREIGRLTTLAEQNRGAAEFWGRYCNLGSTPLDIPDEIPEVIRRLHHAASALLELKARSPLEPVQCSQADFGSAFAAFQRAESKAQVLASAVTSANGAIAAKKREAGLADVSTASAQLARLKATKLRHSTHVAELCAKHGRWTSEKGDLDQQKNQIRDRMNTHTANVIAPYEERINDYLESFNAGFRIRNTRHSYHGGQPASMYQLIINDRGVNLGDRRTPNDVPSFKNTLSSGDRTALALAFFLSSILEDPDRSAKAIVFDDPSTARISSGASEPFTRLPRLRNSAPRSLPSRTTLTF